MIRGRFGRRLALAVGAVVSLAMAGTGFILIRELRQRLVTDLSRGLQTQAALAALKAGAMTVNGAPTQARFLAAACACRVTLILPDGRLAGDSELDGAALAHAENHATRPEVAAALAGSPGVSTRHSATVGRDMLYAAAPIIGSRGRIVGAARLAVSLAEVEARVGRVRMMVFWTMLGALLAALGASAAVARSVAHPVAEMAAAARRLSAGHYDTRVRGLGSDELGTLGTTLNELASRVQDTVSELRRDKAQLEAVLDQMDEAVVAVDSDGRVLIVNPALSRLLGVSSESAHGRPYLETLRHNGIARLIRDVMENGLAVTQELRLFAPEEMVFDAHAAVLTAPDGRVGGALVVLHDISRLRRLEAMRRDFVANVSHELRTPLASIKGFSETLRNGAVDDRENRFDFLDTIIEHTDRLTKLVDDLLDLSAIESGHRSPKKEDVDVAAELTVAAKSFSPLAETRGVRLNTDVKSSLPKVVADPAQLRQILANLLDNAIKYTEKGGAVELSAEAWMTGVRVSVSDSGVGIPASDLPRVFERFYRVDKARSRDAGGTGLGLSIVMHLVEAHGGVVSVESRQPGGSTFRFTLPST